MIWNFDLIMFSLKIEQDRESMMNFLPFNFLVSPNVMSSAKFDVLTISNVLAFISGILAGFYYLGGRKLRKEISLPTYALVVYFSSAITMWIVVMVQDLEYVNIPKSDFQLFFLMALVPTLLGHTMQNWALAFLPAYVVSITLLVEPVGSGILAWHFFEEVPSLGVFIGGLIVLFGVCMVALSEKESNS